MTDAATRLKDARERAGYGSAKEAAEAMGVKVPTYIQHENGTRGFPASKADRYAKFFRVQPEWLLYGTVPSDKVTELGPRLYVVGEVAAGVFRETWKVPREDRVSFSGIAEAKAPLKDRFGLKVVGDSMDELYPPGTILECRNWWGNELIENGKRVIVQRTRRDGSVEATVKEYLKAEDGAEWLVPRSRNPIHQAFRGDQPGPGITRVEIVAVVVASIRPE